MDIEKLNTRLKNKIWSNPHIKNHTLATNVN